LFFEGLFAAGAVFFGGGGRDIVFGGAKARCGLGVHDQRGVEAHEGHVLAPGVNLVVAMRLLSLGDGCVFLYVFFDLASAATGVVGAEADFALLGGVRNDAHFGAAEIVVEQVLEPHAGDKQKVPRVGLAALHGVFISALGRSAAVLGGGLGSQRPGLVELLEE